VRVHRCLERGNGGVFPRDLGTVQNPKVAGDGNAGQEGEDEQNRHDLQQGKAVVVLGTCACRGAPGWLCRA
jgi:hypothetical protein